MSNILPFIRVEDFGARLTKAQRARLRETEICREYLATQARLGDLAQARLDAGGSLIHVQKVKWRGKRGAAG